jgi:murein DD-endopeptidase MepM/ murein hydrolase activator NlpD
MPAVENRRTPRTPRVAALAACASLLAIGGAELADGQDLQTQLSERQSELEGQRDRKGVLSTELAGYEDQLDQLAGEVATLRNREAVVVAELRKVQARLHREKERLEQLKAQLQRSLNDLRNRLVDIYKSGDPDLLTVLLESDGFDDLLSRYEYLRRISDQDSAIVGKVRDLRDGTRITVERVTADRDEIAAKKAELGRTRAQLESREAALDSVRDRKAAALDQVQSDIHRLEGDIGEIQGKIQAQIQAATETPTTPLPAGPIQGASSGFIWPVNGSVTSPFGWRWGRMHEGVDIGVPAGTPIRAAKAGNVILAAYTSGYGNYTCIDHGGGLSTCYAHQSSYATSVGASVAQGDVIGYVGCTGSCFGDHLHFEVRVDGAAVDPLGYL